MSSNLKNVLIVGAGLTGAVISDLIQNLNPKICNIFICEKSRGSGGRMSTSRNPKNEHSTLDLGAQYISLDPKHLVKNKSFHDSLLDAGVLKPLRCKVINMRDSNDGTKHYITPNGVSSIVKHFLRKSGSEIPVFYNNRISELTLENDKWRATSEEGFDKEFDSVVLTIPVPQILELKGDIHNIIEKNNELKHNLQSVQYSSRYALGLFFPPDAKLDLPWDARYCTEAEDSCIRFISIDDRKRGQEKDGVGTSMVIHTSVPFGLEHLEEDKEKVQEIVLEHLSKLLPNLPKPESIKCQRWRYSQVFKSYPGSPGAIVISENPLLIACGDAFTHSNMDGCLSSASSALDVLKSRM